MSSEACDIDPERPHSREDVVKASLKGGHCLNVLL